MWKHAKQLRFENAFGKTCEQMRLEHVKNMWIECEKMWTNGNKRQLKSSCFLAPFFPFYFPDIVFFQVFFEIQF